VAEWQLRSSHAPPTTPLRRGREEDAIEGNWAWRLLRAGHMSVTANMKREWRSLAYKLTRPALLPYLISVTLGEQHHSGNRAAQISRR